MAFTGKDVAYLLAGGGKPAQVRKIMESYPSLDSYLADASDHSERSVVSVEPKEVPLEGMWALALGEDGYPSQLMAAPGAPIVLFGRGEKEALSQGVAVVGTRDITALGTIVARTSVEALVGTGAVVHSGMAFGCDAAAHEAALELGVQTTAVLASGCDLFTPRKNADLGERILSAGGAVISEQLPGTPVFKQNLMARNRIVAGLSVALVVCEASLRSGTMGAVRNMLAAERPVVVVSPRAAGRGLPGAEALLALGDPGGRDPKELGITGKLAERVREMRPVAQVASDRDELRAVLREIWSASQA